METSELLDAARVGFAGLDVAPSTQESALTQIKVWLDDPRFIPYRAQLIALAQAERWSTLLDSFYRVLPFGTGGRRGRVGIGPNRFNPWTFATSIEGHARWLVSTHPNEPIAVVIGYDVREFKDHAEVFVDGIQTPVTGIRSSDFGEIAAEIYSAHEITVFMPPPDTVLSTPELSFTIRDVSAQGGLIISASHNPPDDNGSKFYHAHGGQLVPPFDQDLSEAIADVTRVERMSLDRGVASGLIRILDSEVHTRYVETTIRSARSQSNPLLPMVLTPLHGTADTSVGDVLKGAGVPLTLEPSQTDHDGSFPTVPFRSPNPERAETLDRAIATADDLGIALVMGCDPDADRLGVAVKHHDEWVTLNGNEIAALVTHAVLEHHPHSEPLVLKTEVTTSLVSRIAESKGARVVDDLLVGFKYIGHALFMVERKGRLNGHDVELESFAVGVEESHGVLVTPETRDKDAAGGALVLAQLATAEAKLGRTLVDTLNDLMAQHGVFANHLGNVVLEGATGGARIEKIMASFRAAPPTQFGDRGIKNMTDRQDPNGPGGPIASATDQVSRNQLSFALEGANRVTLRPSGTEPKLKVYIELSMPPFSEVTSTLKQLKQEAAQLHQAVLIEMLSRVGVTLPAWAFDIDDSVNLDTKIEWSTRVVPALLEKLEMEPDTAADWLHNTLDVDARTLLKPGILSLIDTLGFDHETLRHCFDSPSETIAAD